MISNIMSLVSTLGTLSPYFPEILLINNEIGFNNNLNLSFVNLALQRQPELNETGISGDEIIILFTSKDLSEQNLETMNIPYENWIVVVVVEDLNFVRNISTQLLHFNTKVFLWSISEEQLFQAYYVTPESDLIVKAIGSDKLESLTYQRKDFVGAQLTGSHVNTWNIFTKSGHETLEFVKTHLRNQFWLFGGGMEYEWWSYTQDFLNFTLRTITASGYGKVHFSNNTLGNRNETRRWTGITEQIETKVADFAISDTIQLRPFARGFRFLTPHNSVIKTYLHYISSSHAFVQPYEAIFKAETWICIAGTLFFILLFKILITEEGLNAKLESIVWIFAIITQKNWEDKETNPSSHRILTLSGSFLCLILYTTFCSQLISSLSIDSDSFVEVGDLIRKGFTFGIDQNLVIGDRDGDVFTTTSVSDDPLFYHLDKTLGFPTYQIGVETLFSRQKYGWLSPFSTVYPPTSMRSKWTHERLCSELKNIELPEFRLKVSSIVRKDSPYAKYFNYARMVMKERGIESLLLQRSADREELNSLDCIEDDKLWYFGIGDLTLPFGIFINGIGVSILILILEVEDD